MRACGDAKTPKFIWNGLWVDAKLAAFVSTNSSKAIRKRRTPAFGIRARSTATFVSRDECSWYCIYPPFIPPQLGVLVPTNALISSYRSASIGIISARQNCGATMRLFAKVYRIVTTRLAEASFIAVNFSLAQRYTIRSRPTIRHLFYFTHDLQFQSTDRLLVPMKTAATEEGIHAPLAEHRTGTGQNIKLNVSPVA